MFRKRIGVAHGEGAAYRAVFPDEKPATLFKDLEIYKDSQDPKIKEKLKKNLNSVYSLIDKGTKRNVFHKNTADRKKSQLAAYLKSI